jgi:hypothetical protein
MKMSKGKIAITFACVAMIAGCGGAVDDAIGEAVVGEIGGCVYKNASTGGRAVCEEGKTENQCKLNVTFSSDSYSFYPHTACSAIRY